MSETDIQTEILIADSEAGSTLWQQPVGTGWCGKFIRKMKTGRVILDHARAVAFGLCRGSADCIGIEKIVITQAMVGKSVGVFVSKEVKTPIGRATQKQKDFCEHVLKMGGIAGFVNSVQQSLALTRKFIEDLERPSY